jgi:hypothetical protein
VGKERNSVHRHVHPGAKGPGEACRSIFNAEVNELLDEKLGPKPFLPLHGSAAGWQQETLPEEEGQ